jgi:hypothetical protein
VRSAPLKNALSIVLRLMFALAVLLSLWCLRFRYDHIVVESETYLVRVQRVTGDADILIPGEGWVPAEDAWSDSTETPPTATSAWER